MKRLEGKVVVVIGGNSGIGLATAQRLQQEGARVAIAGRSKKTLDEAVKTIGNGVLAVQADVAKLGDVDKLFAEVSKKLGKIDVLFVNAGVAKFAPLADTPESVYDEQFDINAKGAYFTIQKAIPFLNDGASIILNTSVVDAQGSPNTSAYAATKAALRSFARTAAAELVGRGIRPCQHGRAGAHRNADLRADGVAAGSDRRFREGCSDQSADEAVWTTGGSGRSRGVPGLARRVLHHGRRDQCGRRNGTNLTAGCSSIGKRRAKACLFLF